MLHLLRSGCDAKTTARFLAGAQGAAMISDRLFEGREFASFLVVKDIVTADYVEEKPCHGVVPKNGAFASVDITALV
jgi:hypothetical protein